MMVTMTDARHSDTNEIGFAPPGPHDPAIDRVVVEGQIGRHPRAMAGVGARCVYGFPAATRQAPTDEDGHPFPTAFYLTCPHLVKRIDQLEAGGGVKAAEQAISEDPELHAATMRSHARHAALDDRGFNIAASSDPERLKCLHAHAAFQLAMGDHPLGAQVLRDAAPRWCDDARCASLATPPVE